jgi:hypothetical protein
MFQVVYPYESTIYGDSFKEAIKQFVKLNHDININKMIIKDRQKQMIASINYYKQDSRNKVGINMYPVGLDYPIPILTSNTQIPISINRSLPLNPMINPMINPIINPMLSPMISPGGFIPTVINIPNY